MEKMTKKIKYKVLKIKTLTQQGWCDRTDLLLHSAFQLLVDFLEQEKPDTIVDYNYNEETKAAWEELQALYKWWTATRPGRVDPLDDKRLRHPKRKFKKIVGTKLYELLDYDHKKYAEYDAAIKKHGNLLTEWGKEDQDMLHRLVDIRQGLWC